MIDTATVCLLGSAGNMGKRYAAILDHLGAVWEGYDKDDEHGWQNSLLDFTHFIVATSADSHAEVLNNIREHPKYGDTPILCEKPLGYGKYELGENEPTYMVNNYAFIYSDDGTFAGKTEYNYYNSGKDQQHWDCIQIICLDRSGQILLSNASPIWFCQINGIILKRELVDFSYVAMVKAFLDDETDKLWGPPVIEYAHQRVRDYEANYLCKG
jgi:hypothetical protein